MHFYVPVGQGKYCTAAAQRWVVQRSSTVTANLHSADVERMIACKWQVASVEHLNKSNTHKYVSATDVVREEKKK